MRAAFPAGASVLVAVSGGADSVALLSACIEAGLNVTAVHCNFHLRGAESDRDAAHAAGVAERLGVELIIEHCYIADYQSDNPGDSVEMACRKLRYDAFQRICAGRNIDWIAVGHHREDNRETMLLNLFRGSGLKGVGGMTVLRGRIVRPFIRHSREEIIDYLTANGLEYVTDSTNLTCDYRRNAIRNAILPAARTHFPALDSGLDASLEALAAQRRLLASFVGRARRDYMASDGSVELALLLRREECPKELLFELLNFPDYAGYTMTLVDDMVRSAGKSGLIFRASASAGYRLERGRLVPLSGPVIREKVTFGGFLAEDCPGCFAVERIEPQDFRPRRGESFTAYFDEDSLRANLPLTLRTPHNGDRMSPFGMKGSRLLSDIFSDAKLSLAEREAHPVVTDSEGQIIWLPGLRASTRYTVTPTTRSILRVTFVKRVNQTPS